MMRYTHKVLFFFFNDTATTEIYTLSLHDALPILLDVLAIDDKLLESDNRKELTVLEVSVTGVGIGLKEVLDRKSTRLNSSHSQISYAVFCLKKKKKNITLSTLQSTLKHTQIRLVF